MSHESGTAADIDAIDLHARSVAFGAVVSATVTGIGMVSTADVQRRTPNMRAIASVQFRIALHLLCEVWCRRERVNTALAIVPSTNSPRSTPTISISKSSISSRSAFPIRRTRSRSSSAACVQQVIQSVP